MNHVTKTSQHTRASIATFTGVEFFPLAPRYEDIYVADLAHALANTCRYNGHTFKHYSVAQHCVLVSKFLETIEPEHITPGLHERLQHPEGRPVWDPIEVQKWGLLHDASEAYVSDICAPIKPFIQGYEAIEDQLLQAVAQRFSLPWPFPDVVKYADKAIFRSEVESSVIRQVDWWVIHPEHPDAGTKIDPWPAEMAESMYLGRFEELFGKEVLSATCWPPKR